MIINVGTMYTGIDYESDSLLREKVQNKMHKKMGVKEEGAIWSKAYKSGYWDGITDFYNFKEDTFHTGLLHQFLEGVRELQKNDSSITYKLNDVRPKRKIKLEDVDDEVVLNDDSGEEDIILRDYQMNAVKGAFEDQVCILNISTGGGKTEIASGIIQQILPKIKRNERIAFLCDSKEIINQSIERVSERLGIPKSKLGKIGDGKFDVKNKQIVFAMIPTLHSSLKDPKKGVKFTHKERVTKFIATDIADKFVGTANTRQLLRNYIKNCNLTTKVWESALEHLQYIAYSNDMTDKKAQMQLKKYQAEFDKILEKKNKKKFDKYKQAREFLDSVVMAIHDEAHSSQGDTIFKTMSQLRNAQYRVALTGTVDKSNKMLWQKMQALYSPKTYYVSNDYLINQGVSSKPIIRMLPIYYPKNIEYYKDYLEVYKAGIVHNEFRNQTISKMIDWFLRNKEGGVLVSVNQIEHGDNIKELLDGLNINCEFTHGGLESEKREEYLEKFKRKEIDVLIASSILDQGVDIKSIAMLVMAGAGKSMRQILQRIGRGLRLNGIEGNTVYVFDFEDKTHKYLNDHYKKRKKIYEEENFDVGRLGDGN